MRSQKQKDLPLLERESGRVTKQYIFNTYLVEFYLPDSELILCLYTHLVQVPKVQRGGGGVSHCLRTGF